MNTHSTATDWYYAAPTGPSGAGLAQQLGPFTWDELYSRAQAGAFGPESLVWHPRLPDWLPASRVPGLFPPGAPTRQPTPRRRSLLPILIPVIALIVIGGGLGAYFGFIRDHGDNGSTVTTTADSGSTTTTEKPSLMGAATCKAPDPARVIHTSTWGFVPANEIIVVLADGQPRDVAEALAATLGGKVVGEIEFINAFQIETPGVTEADLTAALQTAQTAPGVELACADLLTLNDVEIQGVRQNPLNDPAYADGRGKGFELIGAPTAWTYIRGSGLYLNDVNVGVVDDGLYKGSGEFDGDAVTSFPDPTAGELTAPNIETEDGATFTDATGSHGTMVAGVIGADPKNGGLTGIASTALGNRLKVSMINRFTGQYGSNTPIAQADPNDPTQASNSAGQSYSMGPLVAITQQIESGAKIINCSWGNRADAENEAMATVYRKFFEKMSVEHPDVLFVCSAGNDGQPRNGKKRYPSGLALPNMITVGNCLNDGTHNPQETGSNELNATPGQEYEVTMAAPGHQVVQGIDPDGQPIGAGYKNQEGYANYGGGTSAAAPQVAAAAAILLSLNPKLTAGEIKDLLSQTARPGPAELGGKILAVDLAVLEVINDERVKLGLAEVTAEDLEKGGVIDAVAISQDQPGVWTVKATIEMIASVNGTEVVLTATDGCEIVGDEATQPLEAAPGEVVWATVMVPDDSEDVPQIIVTRTDNGAASVITFDRIDLNGMWIGTYTFTDLVIDEAAMQAAAEEAAASADSPEEGCAAGVGIAAVMAILEQLKGQAIPLTMEITADMETGTGEAIITIDMSSLDLGEDVNTGEAEPTTVTFTFSGPLLTFQLPPSEGATSTMTATVSRQGDTFVLNGTMTSAGAGYTMTAVLQAAKQP